MGFTILSILLILSNYFLTGLTGFTGLFLYLTAASEIQMLLTILLILSDLFLLCNEFEEKREKNRGKNT